MGSQVAPEDEQSSTLSEKIAFWLPGLVYSAFHFFLFMLFMFQLQALMNLKEGDVSQKKKVLGAGVSGILLIIIANSLYICNHFVCQTDFLKNFVCCARYYCGYKAIPVGLIVPVFFTAAFVVPMLLTGESKAILQSVHTELLIRPHCGDARLLEVKEVLRYELKTGHTSSATRVLANQMEPTNFIAEASSEMTGNVTGLAIASVKREDPKKIAMNYESGHKTTIKMSFDMQVSSSRAGPRIFEVRLLYHARLHGNTNLNCAETGAVCPAKDYPGWIDVRGRWIIAKTEGTSVSIGIKPGAGNCTTTSGLLCNATDGWRIAVGEQVSDAEWGITMRVPQSFHVGSRHCPFAWQLEARNKWWIVGACCLAFSTCCCCTLGAKPERGVAVAIFAAAACAFIIALLFFTFAMLTDFAVRS